MKSYGWRTWGDALREMLIGALVGCAILIFEEGGQNRFPGGLAFARNALLGICIVFLSRGLETAMSWAIEQSRIPTTFRAIVYTVGGLLGYFLGVMLASFAFGFEARDFDTESFHFAYVIGIVPVLSILIGLTLHHNRKRNDRLRASIERLKEHEFAEKELEIARSMQQRLLPPPDIDRDGYRVSARTQAAHLVGGDFYDVFSLADGAVAILAADVSGKGIAASLLMASCKATVPFLAATGSAAEVMNALNAKLFDQLERREFVAMVFGRFEPDTGNLELVNAGMPDPFVTRKDGLPEAMVGGVPVGYERIEEYVRSSRSVDELLEKVRGTESVRIEDDVTVVMLERHSDARSSVTPISPSVTRASLS